MNWKGINDTVICAMNLQHMQVISIETDLCAMNLQHMQVISIETDLS